MSGVEFVEALKRIGYPGADQLDGHNFDWLFDSESVVSFLTWFCKEVQSSNVLDEKDLEEYHELEAAPSKAGTTGLLSGAELEEMLQRWSLIDDSSSTDNTPSDTELVKLHEELSVCRQRRDELKSLHDKLALHHAAITDRVSRIDVILNSAQSEYHISAQQMQLDNANMNKSLESVISSVSDLLALYKSMSTSSQAQAHNSDHCSGLISHSSLENYHTSEEKFTQQVVSFTKKQFFDGIGEIAGHSESSDYELVDVSNPDLLLVKGSNEDVVLEARKELTHLKLLYPVSEAKRIDALIEERSTTAACEFQEREIRHFKDSSYPLDQPCLSARLRDAQTSFASLNRDMLQLTDVKIPSLIKDVASLQSVKVLRGDYDLKIARQDYFTSNQDQVIDQLVLQRSRNEFLTMALELESRSHRDVHKLLTAITLLLQKMHVSLGERTKMMLELDKATARTSRTTVDSRDKFLHSIHQLLDDEMLEEDHLKSKALFVTCSQIEQNAERFSNQMSALRASLSTTNRTEHDRLFSLDRELAKCDAVLYADCSTAGAQPSLSPRPVLETMTQLDSLLKKLEQVVMEVIKDIDNKKKVLQKDPLLKTERELFGYFFNDPSRLRHSVHDVEARVQAHSAV